MDAKFGEERPVTASGEPIPAELLPVFNERFVRSHELIEEYVCRLALGVFRRLDLEEGCRDGATLDEALSLANLAPEAARVPLDWILRTLVRRGWLHETIDLEAGPRFRTASPSEPVRPEDILAQQAEGDPASLPAFSIAALAAGHYPAVMRGQQAAEDILFTPENLGAWVDYFSNGNPLYAVNNTLGAMAALSALPAGGGEILEIGGGLGSAAEALLTRAATHERLNEISAYAFTEIAPLFLRRAKKLLSERFAGSPLSFHWLDIDKPFADSFARPGRFALVYGVNVLHVAHDLSASLRRIRDVLRTGGALVIAECVRPFPGTPLYVEFVFNLLKSFRAPLLVPAWRPNGGFLTPEQWTAALAANGFTDVQIYPDLPAIRMVHPTFFVAAVTAKVQ